MRSLPKWMHGEIDNAEKEGLILLITVNKYHPFFLVWLFREWIKK